MSLFIALITSFAAALVFTPVVRSVARRLQYTAKPSAERWHREAVPLLGGLAIAAAFAAGIALHGATRELAPLLVTSGLMFCLGALDDLWHFRPPTKLAAQMAIAAVLLYLLPAVSITGYEILDAMIRFTWIIGVTNAFNLLDNIDGLSAGVATLAGLSYLAVVAPAGGGALPIALACFVGAVGGFLVFNFQPASIFMGDSGSLFIGSFLAGAGLVATPTLSSPIVPVALLPVLILLIPIFDTSFVTLTRRLAGRSPMHGGRDHTSHRLVALGISERRAVLSLYVLAASGGGIALALQHLSYAYGLFMVGLYVLTLAALGVLLGHVESARMAADPTERAVLVSDLTYRYRSYEVVLDAALIALAYYAAFSIRFHQEQFSHFLPYFMRSFPLVVGLQVAGLALTGKYRQVWRTFGATETLVIVRGVVVGVSATVIATLYMYRFEGFSRLVFAIDAAILTFLLVGSRIAITQFDEYLRLQRTTGRRVLIYGAGRAGALLIRELLQNPSLELSPVGFIDDDAMKRRTRLEGLPVLGTFDDLAALVAAHRPAEILISIQGLPPAQLAAISAACRAHGLVVRRMRFALDDLGPLEIRIARHAG